jgi:hypothetical protein
MNKTFDVKNEDIYKDFLKFKRIINKEINNLNFLIKYSKFSDDLEELRILDKDYNFLRNIIIFDKIYDFYYSSIINLELKNS